MRRRDHNIIANAVSLLICGVLAGIVVAAAAFPAIAMGGLAAKAGSDKFAELPTSLNVPTPPQITYVYASDGKTLLATFYDENRHDVPVAEIPQVMRDAIIAAEDQRFYQHNGVDVQGVLRAFVANQQNDDNQGASTLTMQYVRQAITYSATSPKDVLAATETTPGRKVREMRLALGLEKQLTKDQILQNYLNIAAFGHGAYGIYAASQVYFGKEPKDLTLPEAALLAGLPKAPSTNDPFTDTGKEKALDRRSYVLTQMVKLGMISAEQGALAEQSELKVTGGRTPRDCVATTVNHWGFFCDFFYRWWGDQKEFGRDTGERISKLKSGGYRITTTLDVGVQDSAHRNVEQQLPTGNRDALMLAAIEPGSGYVRAMAANRTYSLDTSGNQPSSDDAKRALGIKGTFPNTTNPLLSGGGDISGYKAGSTFKIFTMLAALERGYPLDFQIVARSPYPSSYITGVGDQAVCPDRVHWCPKNADPSMNGPRNMWTGFGRSVNTYFVPLEEKIGAENAIEMAKRLGIHFRNPVDQRNTTEPGPMHSFGPFTIGVTDTVPLELANAYATVAAEGLYCEPMPAVTILDNSGVKVPLVTDPRCKQVVSQEIARAAADAARCPLYDNSGPPGRCAGGTTSGQIPGIVGHPVIGKTGTADDNWTGNLAISAKQLAIAATVADPDKAQQAHSYDASANKANNAAVATLRDALAGKPAIGFTPPPLNLAYGTKVPIPNVTCKSVAEATSALKAVGFEAAIDTKKVSSPCPPGSVAKTDPAGSASKNSTVSLQISDGPGAPAPPTP